MALRADGLIIFNFHGIGAPGPEVPADERPYWCPEDLFPKVLESIRALSVEFPSQVLVTFDDGNRSDRDIAVPALSERGMTAEFFVCADRIGAAGFLGPDDLSAMERAGMKIGSHGAGHRNLRQVDKTTLEQETVAARKVIDAYLDKPIDSFAIPFGSYDRTVLRALRGYRRVYNSDQIHARATQWLMPRLSYTDGWTPDTPRAHVLRVASAAERVKSGLKTLVKRLR